MRLAHPERLVVAPSREEMAGAVEILNRTVIRSGVTIGLGSLRGAHLHRLRQQGKRLILVLAEEHPWAGLDTESGPARLVAERLEDQMAERHEAEFHLSFGREGRHTCLTLEELTGRGTWITTLAAHLVARGAAAAAVVGPAVWAPPARQGSLAQALAPRGR